MVSGFLGRVPFLFANSLAGIAYGTKEEIFSSVGALQKGSVSSLLCVKFLSKANI